MTLFEIITFEQLRDFSSLQPQIVVFTRLFIFSTFSKVSYRQVSLNKMYLGEHYKYGQ